MFKSIKEKLTLIKNNLENQTHILIANYLLECIENKKTPKINECSKKAFCSESVITAFSKKYGYEGFKELATRIKVEIEYYNYNTKHNNIENEKNKYYKKLLLNSFEMIDDQYLKTQNIINSIKNVKRIFVFSSYQQMFNAELFTSELNLLGYDARFNFQRKLNQAWINIIDQNDLVIVMAFGLDNQYLVNHYELIKNKTKNIFLISSPSQMHKFEIYKELIVVDCYERANITESTRSILLMYLLSQIVFELNS